MIQLLIASVVVLLIWLVIQALFVYQEKRAVKAEIRQRQVKEIVLHDGRKLKN